MKSKLLLIGLFSVFSIFTNAQEKQNSNQGAIRFNESSEFNHTIKCSKSNSSKASGDQHWDTRFDSTNSPNGPVLAIATIDTFVYIGGSFTKIGSLVVNGIARWDGHNWMALGDGVDPAYSIFGVYSIAVLGNDVYIGGLFNNAGGIFTGGKAKWDGTNWSPMGAGSNGPFNTLAFDQNWNLFAGGCFTWIGADTVNHVAKWNTTSSAWTNVGEGVKGYYPKVYSMIFSGSSLFVGGDFSIAGTDSAKNIALWNGSTWTEVGGGTDSLINCLTLKGTDIYAGGEFSKAGGNAANHFAKWNGTVWSDIDGGVDYPPLSIAGCPSDVYVASSKSSIAANNITKYDCCWDPLGSGLNNKANVIAVNGKDVWVGGEFTQAGGKPSYYFAHWNAFKNFDGINENELSSENILIYPNPADNNLNIEFQLNKTGNIGFTVFDINGRKMLSKSQAFQKGNISTSIDIKNLAPGNYILEVSSSDFKWSKKLIID